MKKVISLLVFLSLVGTVGAEPLKYTVVKLDANFYNIPGCGERQSMLSPRTADYLFRELKEPLNWTGRRTQILLDGEPAERFTNAYAGNIGVDDMIMKSGQGHVRNITMPKGGFVNLAVLNHNSPMWDFWDFVKYHNITIEGKSSWRHGYNIKSANTTFIFPLNNFSLPISVIAGEQLNITMLGLDGENGPVNCIAEDYFSRDVFAFYVDDNAVPSINSFSGLDTKHYIPSVAHGSVNTSLGIWYIELEDGFGGKQNLSLSGQYPWEKNLSGVVNADANGSFNFTVRVCEEYGSCYEEKFTRTVAPAPDVVEGQVVCNPNNVSVGDEFTCSKNVTNRGSAQAVDFNATLYLRSNPILLGWQLVNVSSNETKEVSFSILNWTPEMKKEIGYHGLHGVVLNATEEYTGNNEYLSSWDAFRVILGRFFLGGSLSKYVPNWSVWNASGMVSQNLTSTITDYIEPTCNNEWCVLRFYYNITALTQDLKSPSLVTFKKYNSTSGVYYPINTSFSWVYGVGANLSGGYVWLNASSFSPITIEFGDMPQEQLQVQMQTSSGGGGGFNKLAVIIAANDIDYGLSSQTIEWRYPKERYDVYRLDARNASMIDGLVGRYYQRLVAIDYFGGPLALEGMGEVVRSMSSGGFVIGSAGVQRHVFIYRDFPYSMIVGFYPGRDREETSRLYAEAR